MDRERPRAHVQLRDLRRPRRMDGAGPMTTGIYRFPSIGGGVFTAWRTGDVLCLTYQCYGVVHGGVERFRIYPDEVTHSTPRILADMFYTGKQARRVA